MKMRELEQRTGVDREVIRILIREGLLPQPKRLARNAAEYDESHVAGVAAIRALQKGSRLKIREIKALLNGEPLDRVAPSSAYRHLESLLAHRFGLDDVPIISISSLAERYPMASRDAEAFAAMGMLTILDRPEGPGLSLNDARLVEIWGQIREAGFADENGFPPENIAFYLDAAEAVAAKEASTFFERGKQIDEEQAAAMLHTALPLMLDFFGLLRIKAFMRNVELTASAKDAESR